MQGRRGPCAGQARPLCRAGGALVQGRRGPCAGRVGPFCRAEGNPLCRAGMTLLQGWGWGPLRRAREKPLCRAGVNLLQVWDGNPYAGLGDPSAGTFLTWVIPRDGTCYMVYADCPMQKMHAHCQASGSLLPWPVVFRLRAGSASGGAGCGFNTAACPSFASW